MRVWLGDNLLDDASGVIYVDGQELLSIGMTGDGAALPNVLVYSREGDLLARLRRGAWVHRAEQHVVDTRPDHLTLRSAAGQLLVQLERRADQDGVDAVFVTYLDLWSRAGFRYSIADSGPLVVRDRQDEVLATFTANRFLVGFRGFQATPAESEHGFELAADVILLSRAARGLRVERNTFAP